MRGQRHKLMAGDRFGRWTIVEYVSNGVYKCKCDCGIIRNVKVTRLLTGESKSCGCLHREITTKLFTTHGLSKHPLYKTWHNMRSRCKNPNATKYELYGGRGIKVCAEWDNDFPTFYIWAVSNGWEYGLSIDRIDGNGNYEPCNCRWVSSKTQANNTSQTRKITFDGQTMGIYAWAENLGISKKMLSERFRRGWAIERALTTPNTKEVK